MRNFPAWAVQYPWEWQTIADILSMFANDVKRVLEIGVHMGGSMMGWMDLYPTARFVGVDITLSNLQVDLKGMGVTLIQGNSADQAIVEQVRALGPYDFIFIDGDHSYPMVKADFDNYKTMISPHGIIGFHDVMNTDDTEVPRVWKEILDEQYRTITVACTRKMGVGLIVDGCQR